MNPAKQRDDELRMKIRGSTRLYAAIIGDPIAQVRSPEVFSERFADAGVDAAVVGDVVITQTPAALIRLAVRWGCPWVDGRDMHAGQVDSLTAFFASASRSATPGQSPTPFNQA